MGPPHVDAGKPVTHVCDDTGVTLTDGERAALAGIYEISYFTRNLDGCDLEGVSLLGEGPKYGIVSDTGSLVTLMSCTTLEGCREGDYGSTQNSFFERVTRSLGADLACGFLASSGYHAQNEPVCNGAGIEETRLLRLDATRLRLTRRVASFDVPESSPDGCSTGPAEETLEAECTSLTVIELEFVEAE